MVDTGLLKGTVVISHEAELNVPLQTGLKRLNGSDTCRLTAWFLNLATELGCLVTQNLKNALEKSK